MSSTTTNDEDETVEVNENESEMEVISTSNESVPSMTRTFFFFVLLPFLPIGCIRYFELNGWPDLELNFMNIKIEFNDPPVPDKPPPPSPRMFTDLDKSSSPPPSSPPSYFSDDTEEPNSKVSSVTKKSKSMIYEDEVMEVIRRRKLQRQQEKTKKAPTSETSARSTSLDMTSNPDMKEFDRLIKNFRFAYKENPNDFRATLNLAEALRLRDLNIHDGGSMQFESIKLYKKALGILKKEATPKEDAFSNIYLNLGKVYFMGNMFHKALENYELSQKYDPHKVDPLVQIGATYHILGRFSDAAKLYKKLMLIQQDEVRGEVYTGLTNVLKEDETLIEGGWDYMVVPLKDELQETTLKFDQNNNKVLGENLKRFHLALFSYYDIKVNDTQQAWEHLSKAMHYKLIKLPTWQSGFEIQRASIIKSVFQQDFWPVQVGSKVKTPIFIIGFVRSGSTLLERILASHPNIVGTGEDSVFNGRLQKIRDEIVEASSNPNSGTGVQHVVEKLAKEIVSGMSSRWKKIQNSDKEFFENKTALRFTDKMLTNYMNVGFIHMLFPDALILHVVRDPMDSIFSAYKHDFPPGTLDYSCQFPSLAELYNSYRSIMDHWEEVLPGRITHILYKDMVQDLERIAPAIIRATGLQWDPEVLNFNKKAHAVNTLSTTQVRKKVYSHHLGAWMRYLKQLEPLKKLIGKNSKYDIKTNLQGYKPLTYM